MKPEEEEQQEQELMQELQELATAPAETIQRWQRAGSNVISGQLRTLMQLLGKDLVEPELGNRELEDGSLVARVIVAKVTDPSSPYCGFPGGTFTGKTNMRAFQSDGRRRTRKQKKKQTINNAASKAINALSAYKQGATEGATEEVSTEPLFLSSFPLPPKCFQSSRDQCMKPLHPPPLPP